MKQLGEMQEGQTWALKDLWSSVPYLSSHL